MYRNQVITEMESVFRDMPFGIKHTMRVLMNADEIMAGESVDDKDEIIALAAILHDIGAVNAKQKYNSIDGHYQEIEGPSVAKEILERVGVADEIIQRVCYIVGNHHTPSKIDGVDFQILWDADFLDNLEFGKQTQDREQLVLQIQENCKTVAGKNLAMKRCGVTQASKRIQLWSKRSID